MNNNLNLMPMFLLMILIFLMLMFSPLICFVVIAFVLTIFPYDYVGKFRLLFSLICYFCIVFIFYSKDYFYAGAPDYLVYSQANEILKKEYFSGIFEIFPNEFGWPLVYWVLNKFGIGFEGINGISFGNTLLSLIVFILWFELHAIKLIKEQYRCLATASTLIFMSIVSLGFLQRQALSVAILLFAISHHNNKKFYFYLLLSSIFHNTSLIIGIVYKILINSKINLKIVVFSTLVFFAIRLFFLDFLLLLNKFGLLESKSNFYMRIDGFQIVSFRLALYGLMLFVLSCLYVKNVNNYFKNIILFSSIFFVCFIGVNLVSERINFILIYCFGFFVALLLLPKHVKFLICINLIILSIFILEKFGVINSDFMFWERYSWFGTSPFYYVEEF